MSIKILIVDDELMIRLNLQAYLEDEGYRVAGVDSAEQGLNLLDTEKFDLAIVDMRLPNMNGNDFILAALAKGHLTKFIIHTGSSEYLLPKVLQEQGLRAEQILYKPIKDMRKLLELILLLIPPIV